MSMSVTMVTTDDGELPMVWWEQAEPARELAVALPGRLFGCGAPPLAYATLALQARGSDVAWVNWSYDRDPAFDQLTGPEQVARLLRDARAGLEAALARHPRDAHVVAGKSLGTLAMARLMDEGRIPSGTRTIWLTPLLGDPSVRDALDALDAPGLLVIGDRDPVFDEAALDAVARRGVCDVVVLDGANHALTVDGDLDASARVLRDYLSALGRFLPSHAFG